MFKLVIFDWDGTLAESGCVVVASFRKVLDKLSISVEEGIIEKRLGTSAGEIFREILEKSGITFDDETINDLVERRVKAELEMSDQVRLKEGAIELLSLLKGKIKIALASMNNKQIIDRMIIKCGLSAFFDFILSADDVSNAKPDPEIFLSCAAKLGVPSGQCAVVEDSVYGVRAAKAAKMKCIAVLSGVSSETDLKPEHPDLTVASLLEKQTISNFLLGLNSTNFSGKKAEELSF